MWAGVSYCALLLLSSATAQGASANYQDSTSATQEGLCSKGFKGWRLLQNGLWIGADCCQAACSLEASSNPQGTIYYFLHRREVLSCWRRGEKEEIFYTDKMLMLSSCAPVRFKGQSNCLGHSSSVPYVQMDFGDERRRQFGVQTVVFGSLIHLQASQQGHIVACVSWRWEFPSYLVLKDSALVMVMFACMGVYKSKASVGGSTILVHSKHCFIIIFWKSISGPEQN